VRRALTHYWRIHLAVALGAATAATVLTGALLVGDSVRGSLRALALERLGHIDHALLSERFFRASLADDLSTAAVPAVLLSGAASQAQTRSSASRVQIQGIDDRFTALFDASDALLTALEKKPAQIFPSVVVNAALQRELGAAIGDPILLTLERQSQSHRESLFGRRSSGDVVATLRLTLAGVLPDRGAGRFGLQPHQHLPLNAYVHLAVLQRALGQTDKVNAILVAAPQTPLADWQNALQEQVDLQDLGLLLERRGDFISLESAQFILQAPIIDIATDLAIENQLTYTTILTYLANKIGTANSTVPYSTVTALSSSQGLRSIDATPLPQLADDGILLNQWSAQELKAMPGDSIAVTYYVVGPREELSTRQAHFRLQGIVAMQDLAIDHTLTPAYPGIQEQKNISSWEAPFPLDMQLIRPQDEEYWDQFGAAPKAFVTAAAGQRLWRSRFGDLTALRFYPPPGANVETAYQNLRSALLQRYDPARAGLVFHAVRSAALQAASGATDFSGLFIGFSLFLIVAAALLVVLLFKFGMEQRATEVGLLLASGYTAAAVRWRFIKEGLFLASSGGLVGLGGALLYAHLLLVALRTWWLDAVGTPFLHLHITWPSLVSGYVLTLLLVSLTIWQAVRRFHRLPIRALLTGAVDADVRQSRRLLHWCAASGLVLALALSGAALAVEATTAAGLFFGSGACALLAGLAFFSIWLRSSRRHALRSTWAMGVGNSARNPARSALCTALIASASFVIVAVGANRRLDDHAVATSGSGGFAVLAEANIPLHQNLNDTDDRFALGISANLDYARFFSLRLLPGEDISCLNLYQPSKPRVLGLPQDFIQRGGFHFQQTVELSAAEQQNPWLLLERELEPGVIPAIGDLNSVLWILHRGLGDDVVVENEAGQQIKLRLLGLLQSSIFQSELLIAATHFTAHFANRSGYSYFLIQTPTDKTHDLAATLEKKLAPYGFDVTSTAARLAAYHAVENTYLSTFQTLGGLGLLLGTLGLGILLLRNVLERSGELATLRACGFRQTHLGKILLAENSFLLLVGICIGTAAAAIAALPHLLAPAALPWISLGSTLLLVFAVGLATSALAIWGALRAPLLPALKAE
jgi:putative ABC transport system permease protein